MKRTKVAGIRWAGVLIAVTVASVWNVSGSPRQVQAVEFTVAQNKAVLYAAENAKVYQQPDVNSPVVAVITKDAPVEVTGITSNGWFQISLDGIYYVPGNGLVSKNADTANAIVTGMDVRTLTMGTFSFFRNPQLSDFDSDDVADMDENTYIKYLDSYLMGYAMIENCIMQDSGKTLKEVYESEAKVDQKVAALTMQAYLINYRNNYLSDSIVGPFRNDKDLKRGLNRAIRYDIVKFNAIFKSSSVDNNEKKMKELMEGVVNEIKAEQGVTFSCSMKYGDYKLRDNTTGKGWIIEITRKD